MKTNYSLQCVDDMIQYLDEFADKGKEIHAKNMLANYTLDVICSTGFGIQANSFTDPDNKIVEMVGLKIRYIKF